MSRLDTPKKEMDMDKSEESGAKRVTMRFTPDVLDMIEKGLQLENEETGRNKTGFVKRAIRHYYESLQKKHGVHAADHPKASAFFNQSLSESDYDQLLTSILKEEENRAVSDIVDYIQDSWVLEDNPMPKSFSIYARILRLAQYIDLLETRSRAEPVNLTLNEWRILASLRRNKQKPLTPSTLKKELLVTSGAVTRQIDHLVKLGLVERVQDTVDRRSVNISLTPKGCEVVDHILTVASRDFLNIFIHYLTEEEQKVMEILLRKMIIIMEAYLEKADKV